HPPLRDAHRADACRRDRLRRARRCVMTRRIVLDIIVPVIAVLLSIGVVCVGLWLGTEVRS
ncbi:hypothetical protein, partial [Bifidobacterium boum]|uniref:hypothetical protein n=1 Tax=Bifidobacterium boum TaxID=78343 RepID=UPI003F8FADA8